MARRRQTMAERHAYARSLNYVSPTGAHFQEMQRRRKAFRATGDRSFLAEGDKYAQPGRVVKTPAGTIVRTTKTKSGGAGQGRQDIRRKACKLPPDTMVRLIVSAVGAGGARQVEVEVRAGSICSGGVAPASIKALSEKYTGIKNPDDYPDWHGPVRSQWGWGDVTEVQMVIAEGDELAMV